MGTVLRTVGLAICALALGACGSDGGTGGSGGTAGAGGTAGSGGTAGTGGNGTSTVSGVVYNRDEAEAPVAGATVSVFDTELSTTTNQNGEFTLEGVPNGDAFLVTEAEGTWGIIDYWEVPGETQFGAELGVVPDADIAAVGDALQRTLSTDDGIVDVTFFIGAVGGETASISAASDPPFTFNLADEPVAQEGVIADNDGFGELIFSSVDPDEGPITATVSGVPGTTQCLVDESPGTTYPIRPKSITIVYAGCQSQ